MKESDHYCRACKSITTENYISMEEEHLGTQYKTLYFDCTRISIDDDEFSRILCQTCLRALIFSHEFTQMCKKTQQELKQTAIKTDELNESLEVVIAENAETVTEDSIEEDKLSDETKTCDLCQSQFSSQSLIKQHMKQQHKERQCETCKKLFPGSISFKNHSCQNSPKSITCHICKKSFSTISVLNRHKKTVHEKIRAFPCDQCKKSFQNNSHLLAHQSVHLTNDRPFTCEICSLTFKTVAVLKNHLKLHTSTPNHVCDICGSKFKSSTYLKIHKETHTTERAFTCSICQKAFKTNKTLRDHEKTHDNTEPLDCHVCGKKLKSKVTLKHHLKEHFTPGVQCLDCGRNFPNKHVLRDHIATTHENTRNYICRFDGCDHAYYTSSHLNYHVKAVHLKMQVRKPKS